MVTTQWRSGGVSKITRPEAKTHPGGKFSHFTENLSASDETRILRKSEEASTPIVQLAQKFFPRHLVSPPF
ncbi:hypothetical protein CKO51_06220 [Rhodopirellula sp. SM50]|nr:hypothetical protein CKO51_06220 [Rhodopirellula sp. SM50]